MASTSAPPKRSVLACSRCRQQKMKCSGGPPPCERCARFGRECVFEPATITTTTTTSTRAQQHHQQQSPLSPSGGALSLDSRDYPPRSASDARKRSLAAVSTAGSSRETRPRPPPSRHAGGLLPSAATPYSSVQELECNQQLWAAEYQTPSDSHATSEPASGHSTSAGDRAALLACLAEAGITLADAQDLFALFGERLSPFIPSFYAADFRCLPSEPVYVLATIHAVARYLPASDAMRDRVCRILRRLLSELALEPATDQASTAMLEKMQGLVVLYSCCEASRPNPDARQASTSFDMLALKGIAEAYAVKLKLGVDYALNKLSSDKLPLVWAVWLYTMSHHCAVIHDCPRTLSGSVELLRVKAALEQTVDHPRIRLLLGECELCLLWERAFSIQGNSPQTVYEALDNWKDEWQDYLNGAAAPGRQLYFHFLFTRFHLLTHLVDETGELYVAMGESLDAARDFLLWIKNLSPISKDRLRYLCDFAFVLMAYVCLYVLRALRSGVALPGSPREFLHMVHEVAALMQSLGSRADTRPTVYGYALDAMCKQYQNTQKNDLSSGLPTNVQDTSQAPNLSRSSQVNMEQLPMAADALVDDDLRHSRLSPSFWALDPSLSVFDGIMAGIPVPEEL